MADKDKKVIRDALKDNENIESQIGLIRVKKGIGEGGNALVFNADFGTNEVAVKVLSEDVESNSSKYRRFLTEFREIVQLADTNAVVPIFYFGHLLASDKSYPYILMKKFPFTLKSRLKEHPINGTEEVYSIMKNLLNIVEVIHNHNIIHRDLKPENILIDESGKMVLADFGISWFDPEFFERLAHTEKGERLANYAFSAPEQFIKGNTPHFTMDIFAVAQIITWIITGDVARGDRKSLTEVAPAYANIEPAVKKMLNNNPEERPQTIAEVKKILLETKQELDESRKFNEESREVVKNLRVFNDIILYSFPGKRGLIETNDAKKINKVFSKLEEVKEDINLWWTRGHSNCPIGKNLFKLNEDTWVMDHIEIQIEKLWAFHSSHSLDHQFIIIKTKPMQPFGIYGDSVYKYEEAAWFKDRYITREEYDDGATEIDGETVWTEQQAELRVRDLVPEFYFIATGIHPIHLIANDAVVEAVYEKLKEGKELDEEDIKKLTRLKRHEMSRLMD
jgi:serine/threonine protein kinase